MGQDMLHVHCLKSLLFRYYLIRTLCLSLQSQTEAYNCSLLRPLYQCVVLQLVQLNVVGSQRDIRWPVSVLKTQLEGQYKGQNKRMPFSITTIK